MSSVSLAPGICDVSLTLYHSIRFPVQIAGRLARLPGVSAPIANSRRRLLLKKIRIRNTLLSVILV
jgi:hypothetical protein